MSGHKSPSGKTYRCSGKKAGKTCTSHIIKEENLTKTVLDKLDELIDQIHGNTETSDVSIDRINELQQELKSTQKLLKKQKTMFEADIIGIDELIEKTESLRETEKKITAELRSYKHDKPINNTEKKIIRENIHTLWEYAEDHERKQMITTLFSQIVVDTKDEYKNGTGKPREIIIVSAK